MNGKITVSNGQAVKKLKIHLPYKYYNNTLKLYNNRNFEMIKR